MIALFVIKLSAGITLMWLLMPRRQVTDGFFRIQMRLLLGTTVLTALLLSQSATWAPTKASGSKPAEEIATDADARPGGRPSVTVADRTAGMLRQLQIIAACLAYPGSIFWALGRRLPGNIAIGLLALLCCGSLMVHSLQVPNAGSVWLQVASDGASAAVLGSTLTAMLLGHWYLTTPTMSIQPLWWFDKALLVSAVLRLLVSGTALAQFGLPTGDPMQWWFLLMRLAGGVVAPVTVSILVWRILKYRNTQSATGVLFAGLILVFMGEMAAALLEWNVAIPY